MKNKLSRNEKVNRMIDRDIESVICHDPDRSFLTSVLSGNGWVPYNQLTDEQVDEEYDSRDWD